MINLSDLTPWYVSGPYKARGGFIRWDLCSSSGIIVGHCSAEANARIAALAPNLILGVQALLLAHDSTHNIHPAIEALRGLLAKLEA